MKAALLYSGENRLRIEDVTLTAPGPDDVRVKVECCGVCGSDVHATIHKIIRMKTYPRIMGHESSGVVIETGSNVNDFKTGDRVVILAGSCCMNCRHCRAGRVNACADVGVLGFDQDGAFAEEIVVNAKALTHLPDSIPFDQGAILADAVSTPYHALKVIGKIQPGDKVAVFGCGGLGLHAVLLARALGAASISALDIDSGALKNAEEFGADHAINVQTVRNPGKALREVTGGVDLVLDFSGFYKNIEDSVRALNSLGRIVMVGLGKGGLKLSMPGILTYKQLSICGSYGCELSAISELMQLMENGKLKLDKSITSHHPLADVNDCLVNLHHRKGNPIRFIIKPNS